jgi:tRNA A37 threonylcarbamoyltransferase TsaD
MIAFAGHERLAAGESTPEIVSVRARWPMTELNPLPAARI